MFYFFFWKVDFNELRVPGPVKCTGRTRELIEPISNVNNNPARHAEKG